MDLLKTTSASSTQPTESPVSSANFAGTISTLLNTDTFVGHISTSSTWILDSGASDHICFSQELLSELHNLSNQLTISLPNGQIEYITHICTVSLSPEIILIMVLYVHQFKFNLLSISKLTHHFGGVVTCLLMITATYRALL